MRVSKALDHVGNPVPAVQVSPIVAALDHPEVSLDPQSVPTVALSLVEVFGEVPDPRKARGIRHGVAAILLLGACAVLTGARSFAAIGEYAHDTGRSILDRLGVGAVVPHACTIRRVLSDLDPDAVEAAMRAWVQAQLAQTPAPDGVPAHEQRQVLAMDGKTVRGAHLPIDSDDETGAENRGGHDRGYRQPHLVSVLDQASGAVLGQVAVEEKGSEVTAFTTLLNDLDLTDFLITADAVHTNRNHADYLNEAAATTCSQRSSTSPRCCAAYARCPGNRSASPPGNAATATAGSRPAPSAWCLSTPAPTLAASSSRTPPRPSRSSAADAHGAAGSGPP